MRTLGWWIQMFEQVKTPCYVVDEKKLKENLSILKDVEQQSGARILLAQKAFSMYSLYPLMGKYLSGTTASGLYEARLGYEEMGKENHVFARHIKKKMCGNWRKSVTTWCLILLGSMKPIRVCAAA